MQSLLGKRFPAFWLLVPWLTLIAIIIAVLTDLAAWLLRILPYGLGGLAIQNAGWGMLMVTFGSSARWAYLRICDEEEERATLIMSVIAMATFITIAQIALGLWIAGLALLVLGVLG